MADRYHNRATAGKRQPLSDVANRANTPPVPSRQQRAKKAASHSPAGLPHNESLEGDGSLHVRSSANNSPENKRLSNVMNGNERDNKRLSAISTTSTNASSTTRRRKTFIGPWHLGQTIGKGGCSRVRAVRHKYAGQHGAVKIIARAMAESTRAQSLINLIKSGEGTGVAHGNGGKPIPFGLEREIALMKLLEHPNIVRLFDVWENRNELYLIMEYVHGGELFHYVESRRGLHEDETIFIFRQIISALLYCHRLKICHRDLKPENILLDQDTLQVKLIDFGMAALQPEGRLLNTPCGSPHYAAPEVVSSKPYDGTQADVWSCGVILYVMLTGTTPFNYSPDGDIRLLFHDISKAKYYMPPELSYEARDLIRRIFVPDPKRRITMDGVWDHSLMHKFDKKFHFEGPDGSKAAAIGPVPTIQDWTVKRIQDIDREILHNMRTLWHSETEQKLIRKLLNNDYNQEKIFYAALTKHRDEHLENYAGNAEEMGYSASDYHHSKAPDGTEAPPMPGQKQQRSQSQYSIMNDEHLKASHSFVEPPPSVSSYDPYRASRDPIVNARGEYVNVTVHRGSSSGTRRSSAQRHARQPNALRVEALKHGSRRTSNKSSSSLARSRRSRSSMQRSSVSRHSMTSTALPSSPPVIASMKPSEVHKRGVSFGHLRRTSTTSALTGTDSTRTPAPETPQLTEATKARHALPPRHANQTQESSPATQAAQAVRSRKEKSSVFETPRIKARRPNDPCQHIKSEVRKHSAELEKACEEAFFRSSMGSSTTARSSLTEAKASPYDTPPSEASIRPASATPDIPQRKLPPRPLPDLPRDTPNTYLTRTLEETREKLAAYRGEEGNADNSAKFDEVMSMLERIMPGASQAMRQQTEMRASSAPETKTPDHLGPFMPVISEEAEKRNSRDSMGNWQRSVTAPVQKDGRVDDKTIRVVPASPSGTVAPLNVRKRSNGSEASDEPHAQLRVKTSRERLQKKQSMEPTNGLSSIREDAPEPETPVVRKKKSGWFGLSKKSVVEHEPRQDARSVTPSPRVPWNDADDRGTTPEPGAFAKKTEKELPREPPFSATSSEFPARVKKETAGKKGFSKWLGKVKGDRKVEDKSQIGGDTTLMSNSATSLFSRGSPSPSAEDIGTPSSNPTRSWFARFLHLKPITHNICFAIPRARARAELVLLLKEWQRHGIRDLQFSRAANTITARVDRQNSLDIKPVSFRIELFVVLEHGQRVGLAIARFVQVKGAASGFRRVIEVVDGVMRERGWLVEDEEKWRALCEVVGG